MNRLSVKRYGSVFALSLAGIAIHVAYLVQSVQSISLVVAAWIALATVPYVVGSLLAVRKGKVVAPFLAMLFSLITSLCILYSGWIAEDAVAGGIIFLLEPVVAGVAGFPFGYVLGTWLSRPAAAS